MHSLQVQLPSWFYEENSDLLAQKSMGVAAGHDEKGTGRDRGTISDHSASAEAENRAGDHLFEDNHGKDWSIEYLSVRF